MTVIVLAASSFRPAIMTISRRTIIIAAPVAAALLAIALWFIAERIVGERPFVRSSGTVLIGGPFSLVDQTGRRVSEADFRGRLMVVYFGYTYCPDVCPGELQVISAAIDLLDERAAEVAPIFITVDPERDRVVEMAQYMPNFHPSMVGLTGSPEEIAAAAKAYRVYYAKVEGEDGGAYLMDHSSLVYLMDRQGRYLRHFTFGAAPETIAEAILAALGD